MSNPMPYVSNMGESSSSSRATAGPSNATASSSKTTAGSSKATAGPSKAPEPGERRIRAYHRSRSGCFTCRLRRKKCDETRPSCQTCIKLALKCDYKPPYWWSTTEQRRKQKERIKDRIRQTKVMEKHGSLQEYMERVRALTRKTPASNEQESNRPMLGENQNPFLANLSTPVTPLNINVTSETFFEPGLPQSAQTEQSASGYGSMSSQSSQIMSDDSDSSVSSYGSVSPVEMSAPMQPHQGDSALASYGPMGSSQTQMSVQMQPHQTDGAMTSYNSMGSTPMSAQMQPQQNEMVYTGYSAMGAPQSQMQPQMPQQNDNTLASYSSMGPSQTHLQPQMQPQQNDSNTLTGYSSTHPAQTQMSTHVQPQQEGTDYRSTSSAQTQMSAQMQPYQNDSTLTSYSSMGPTQTEMQPQQNNSTMASCGSTSSPQTQMSAQMQPPQNEMSISRISPTSPPQTQMPFQMQPPAQPQHSESRTSIFGPFNPPESQTPAQAQTQTKPRRKESSSASSSTSSSSTVGSMGPPPPPMNRQIQPIIQPRPERLAQTPVQPQVQIQLPAPVPTQMPTQMYAQLPLQLQSQVAAGMHNPQLSSDAWLRSNLGQLQSYAAMDVPGFSFPNGNTSASMQTIIPIDDTDKPLLDHFLDNVIRLAFPIVEVHQSGAKRVKEIMAVLQVNKSFLHCCLSVSAVHMQTSLGLEDQMDHEIMQHRYEAIHQLCRALGHANNPILVIEATLGMIFYHCSIGMPDDYLPDIPWSAHFGAVANLVKKLPSAPSNFNISLITWIDILGATMTGSTPHFAHAYRTKHLSGALSGLRQLMGCDDRVMYLISEIACLESLRLEGKIDDLAICGHITALSAQIDWTESSSDSELENPYAASGAIIANRLTKSITALFRIATRLYLYSLLPGFDHFDPSVVTMIATVPDILAFIPRGLNGFDRCLVWPLFVAGTYSIPTSPFRRALTDRISALGYLGDFGSYGRMYRVLREIWRVCDAPVTTAPTNTGATDNSSQGSNNGSTDPAGQQQQAPVPTETPIKWREIMKRNDWDYLFM